MLCKLFQILWINLKLWPRRHAQSKLGPGFMPILGSWTLHELWSSLLELHTKSLLLLTDLSQHFPAPP